MPSRSLLQVRVDDCSGILARNYSLLLLGEYRRLKEIRCETQAFGLATTLGVVPDTGISGLTLGGGFGNLMAKYGLALDNLTGVDVVTADGCMLSASASENSEARLIAESRHVEPSPRNGDLSADHPYADPL